ncbi:C2H2 type zinc finger domain protein [Botrytis cinerea]
MASNFPQMGGAGQMMPQQQQQQQQQQQVHMQMHPNRQPQQLNHMIYQKLQQQGAPPSGWQQMVPAQERMAVIFNIIGALRLLSQGQTTPQHMFKLLDIALGFEKEAFMTSPDKISYKNKMNDKQRELQQARMQSQQSMQQQVNSQAQAQQQQQQQQQMMMNQNGMQGQMPRNNPQQPPQQGFQHLQHQMQASPLPPQQPQAMQNGLPNDTLPQNMPQNAQLQANGMQNQIQHGSGRPMNGQPQLQPTPNEMQEMNREAIRMCNEASENDKVNIRNTLRAKMTPQQLQSQEQSGADIAFLWTTPYTSTAPTKWFCNGSSHAATAIYEPKPNEWPIATPYNHGWGPDFNSFLGNMENLIGQQQQAGVLAQEAGQVVVPVSAPRNNTPQPNVTMPGQAINMNEQRSASNPMARTQAQQVQMFNAQQSQRFQQQQQAQQAQARANAAAKAQMGLQGQPGGMGPGNMASQQSPAMNTLNAPMRTPSQQMGHPEAGGMMHNAPFGQSLDPRFGNPRMFGNSMNQFNPAMLRDMGPEQRQHFSNLPPDKMSEFAKNWQARQQQNPMQQAQQMAIQGNNNPLRQGQPGPQSAQLLQQQQQHALNQFMMTHPGQRPPASLLNNLTAQQQQLIVQQQMAQNATMQPRPGNIPADNHRLVQQMDNMDIPAQFLANNQMLQGIPPEVKKWGQLKQWVSTTPTMPPQALESVKNAQKMHLMQLSQARRAAQQQLNQMATQTPVAGQNAMPMAPQRMSAPVAQMGQNPTQIPIGMNVAPGPMRQFTPQDMANLRNHPSGKLLGASDDQLRHILMQNQMNQMQRRQMAASMAQANGQQIPQNTMQGLPNSAQMTATQQPPGQMSQQKPSTSAPEPAATPVPTPANRPRPPPNNKPAVAQNPSPAQPAKNNLKRANSDDVVEVPNPNGQQGPAAAPQQRNITRLTPEQIAKLDPEQKKAYEATLRKMFNARQQPPSNPEVEMITRKFKEFAAEAEKAYNDNPPGDIFMDEESKQGMRKSLEPMPGHINNVSKAMLRWYQQTRDDSRAKLFFRTRCRLAKQFKDPATMREPKDTFSMRPADVEQTKEFLTTMVMDIVTKNPMFKKNGGSSDSQGTSANPSGVSTGQASEAAVPLNAANLQQQQQQLLKMNHQRSNSRSSHPPAAPTSSQPPFPFGASSPHGQPTYPGKPPAFTPEKLHIPARKKQKPNGTPGQGQGTPGSTSSPQITKVPSPEVKRQQIPEPKIPSKPTWPCNDEVCERQNTGFESQEELARHTQVEHRLPMQNPQKFAEDHLRPVLGLDSQNQSNAPMATMDAATSSKQGQTPKVETVTPSASTATPMNRQNSANLQGGMMQGKAKHQSGSVTDTADSQKGMNKDESNAPAQDVNMDPWANATIDPNELVRAFQPFEGGANGAISDANNYRSITPNDTPESSKDGVSEPTSDISEGANLEISLDMFTDSWFPFGLSDTDALVENDITTYGANLDGDLTMFDDVEFANVPQTWDDMDGKVNFNEPFQFNIDEHYSMDI